MEDIYELIRGVRYKKELERILDCNYTTETFRLVLSEVEVNNLVLYNKTSCIRNKWVGFEESILPKIIYLFYDSQFINPVNYAETLSELQEIFYWYKNETLEYYTDEELLNFIKRQYNEICLGDLAYLKNTCMTRFALAISTGYDKQV